MSESLVTLYIDAFCGLVCPFPRLDAMRRNLQYAFDNPEEYGRLLSEERAYYERRDEAARKFWAAAKGANP